MCEIDHTKYFGQDGYNPFEIYVVRYHLIFDREDLDNSRTPLTLRDLVKSAEAKRWMHPETK